MHFDIICKKLKTAFVHMAYETIMLMNFTDEMISLCIEMLPSWEELILNGKTPVHKSGLLHAADCMTIKIFRLVVTFN